MNTFIWKLRARRQADFGRMSRAIVFGAAILISMSGCAVLSVNVDVYKGPLANEQEVQLQEVAVLAIGAKPLLKQFRNEAEKAEIDNMQDSKDRDKKLKDLRDESSNRLNAFPHRFDFLSIEARRANDVLSLYDDRDRAGGDFPQYAAIRRSLDQYIRAVEVLRPTVALPHRVQLAKDLGLLAEDGMKLDPEVDRLPSPPVPVSLQSPRDFNEAASRARSAYLEMLLPRRMDMKGYEAWVFYDEFLFKAYDELYRGDQSFQASIATDADGRFAELANPAWIRRDAEKLFSGKPLIVKERFTEEAALIAQAFLEARSAMSDTLDKLLELRESVAQDSMIRPINQQEFDDALWKLIQICVSTRAVSKINLDLKLQASDPKAAETASLVKSIVEDQNVTDDAIKRAHALEALTKRFQADPEGLIQSLKSLHRVAKAQGPSGIASGPKTLGSDVNRQVIFLANSLLNTLSGSFVAGRPDDGLDKLVDEFIRTSWETPVNKDANDKARNRLLDALVQFAEKMLFLANNAILVDQVDTNRAHRHIRNRAEILQASGNLIMVQVNELLAHQNADQRQKKLMTQWSYANPAMASGANTTPLDTYIAHLEGAAAQAATEKGANSPEATQAWAAVEAARQQRARMAGLSQAPVQAADVMDRIIAELERDVRTALSSAQPKATIDAKRAALTEAYDQRARMVYIRPPWFYLKNSYPVTSLQNNASQGEWKNMLTQQAARSMPLIGESLAHTDQERLRIRTQQQIDQQFWQTINPIRLSAGGTTNYVIAQDAIGNFYTKNYDADPKPIIAAAKAAAMFAAGVPTVAAPATGAPNPPAGLDGVANGSPPSTPPPSKPRQTVLDQQRAYFEKTYAQRVEREWPDVLQITSNLDQKLTIQVTDSDARHLEGFSAKADALAKQAVSEELRTGNSPIISNGRLDDARFIDTLAALARLRQQLRDAAASATLAQGATTDLETARTAARTVIDKIIQAPLSRIVDRHLATLDWYRTSLGALSESSGGASTPAR